MKRNLWICLILICGFVSVATAQTDTPGLNGEPVKVNKETFQKYIYNYEKNPDSWIYEGELPCIIDFYVDWYGPCRQQTHVLKEIAKKYKGKVIVYKVDVEAQRELANYLGIQNLPTIVFVPVGATPQAAEGFLPFNDLEALLGDVFQIEVIETTEI